MKSKKNGAHNMQHNEAGREGECVSPLISPMEPPSRQADMDSGHSSQ